MLVFWIDQRLNVIKTHYYNFANFGLFLNCLCYRCRNYSLDYLDPWLFFVTNLIVDSNKRIRDAILTLGLAKRDYRK
jgi:hypothetical protein